MNRKRQEQQSAWADLPKELLEMVSKCFDFCVDIIRFRSLRVIQHSAPLFDGGRRKNLVESCGDLYVVDRYLDEFDDVDVLFRGRNLWKCTRNTVDIRVHKLDEECGRWVDVSCLGDRVFVLGFDCSFSVCSGELVGGKGNSIYFTDANKDYCGRELRIDEFRVFRLEDRVVERVSALPEFLEIFWPPNAQTTKWSLSSRDAII